jgi:hypothetical protein
VGNEHHEYSLNEPDALPSFLTIYDSIEKAQQVWIFKEELSGFKA